MRQRAKVMYRDQLAGYLEKYDEGYRSLKQSKIGL